MSTSGARRLRAVSSPVILALAAVMCAWFASRAVDAWGAAEPKVASAAPLAPSEAMRPSRRAALWIDHDVARAARQTSAASTPAGCTWQLSLSPLP